MYTVYLKSLLAALITSPANRTASRFGNETIRRFRGQPHEVHYFHRLDDPYSHLMVQILPAFLEKFRVKLVPHVIARLDPDMYPEKKMLASYAVQDCVRLARRFGLTFHENRNAAKTEESAELAGALLALETNGGDFLQKAFAAGEAFWSGMPSDCIRHAPEQGVENLRAAERLLKRKRHYLSATLFYGGEWYWGPDRLYHLEERFSDMGLGASASGPLLEPVKQEQAEALTGKIRHLSYYFSARSPYSYIGYFKARKFAAENEIELDLKPVLPMMMRNMKVPSAKRFYILKDAKREAEKAGLQFGRIADPLGEGVERIYAIAYFARKSSQQEAFFDVALPAVFAKGIDLATNKGLRGVCDEAGLNWERCEAALKNRDWENWVENNRLDMVATGCWGVPTLQYGNVSAWGQDRFWLIEDAI
ncbi:MAG: DsbA family protein [Rhizobiaceae bacterium]